MGAETSREEEIQRAKKLAETTGKMEKKTGGTTRGRDISIMDDWMKAKFKHGVNYNMKVVIRGASGSGKTQLFRLLQGKPYDPLHEPTPSITSANIHWAYKDSPEVIKVEVWDVVDKGFSQSTRAEMLKIRAQNFFLGTGKHSPLSTEEMIADASTVNVYRGCSAVVLLFDITRRDTWEYVIKEMKVIPKSCHVVVLANFYDLHEFRQVSKAEIVSTIRQFQKARKKSEFDGRVYTLNTSMKNCFGLQQLYNYLNIPFLYLKVQALEETVRSLYDEIDREDDNFSILAETQDYSAYHAKKQQGVLASVRYPAAQGGHPDSEPNSPTEQAGINGSQDELQAVTGEEYQSIQDPSMEVDKQHVEDSEDQPRKKHKPRHTGSKRQQNRDGSVQNTSFTPGGNRRDVDDWLGSDSSEEQNPWFPDEDSEEDRLPKRRPLRDRFRDKSDEEDDTRPVPTQHDVTNDPPKVRPKKVAANTNNNSPPKHPESPPPDPNFNPANMPESFNSSFGVGFRKTPPPKLSQTELNERKLQEEIRATMGGPSDLKDFFGDQSESEDEPEPPVFEEEEDLPPRPAMFRDVVDSPDNALEGKIIPRNRQVSAASSEHMSLEFDKGETEQPETPPLRLQPPRPETPPSTSEKPKKVEQTAEMQAVLQAALQNALQAEEDAKQQQQEQQLQQRMKEQHGTPEEGGGASKRKAKKKAGKPKPKGKVGNRPSSRSTTATTTPHPSAAVDQRHDTGAHPSSPTSLSGGVGMGSMSGSVHSIRSHSGSISGSLTTDTETRPSRLSALPPRTAGTGSGGSSPTSPPYAPVEGAGEGGTGGRRPKKAAVLKKKKVTLKKKKQSSSQHQVPDNEIVMIEDKEEEESLQFTIPPCSGQEPLDDDDEELTFGR